jgi:hypothetical protein
MPDLPPPGHAERQQPCDHEVRRADQEDETDDGTRLATVRLRDEPDESLPEYRSARELWGGGG